MQDGKSNYISYKIQRVLQSKCIIKCWYYNRGEPQLWFRRLMRLQYKLGGTLRRLKCVCVCVCRLTVMNVRSLIKKRIIELNV